MNDRPKYDLKIKLNGAGVPEPLLNFLIINAPNPDPTELIYFACEHGFKVTITIDPPVAGLGEKVKVPRGN